ncbi:hypothetical protein SHEWT2_04138 [Shewanella hafniensis]|nr:hypothetical protein SHEWT2_04138 [Shewanella hafniensis]
MFLGMMALQLLSLMFTEMDSRLRGNDNILGNDGMFSSIFREQFKIARVD